MERTRPQPGAVVLNPSGKWPIVNLIRWIHQRSLLILESLQEIVWKNYPAIVKGSIALGLTINIEYVSSGQILVQTMSRLLTTIKGKYGKVGEIGMVRIPTHRPPTHPGEMLLEEFLNPMNLTQRELAEGIRVPYQRVNEIVNGKRGITPSTCLLYTSPSPRDRS